ncbi:MAG: helix-turn-helix domain-containing protein [Phycicoccus sp.]
MGTDDPTRRPRHAQPLPRRPPQTLRTEAGWSQAELAEKIGSDARQVSRYENGRVAPGLDAVIRIAEVFNTTVDYLLFDNAERRPLTAPSSHLDARLTDLDQLTDDERTTITNVIDALITKAKLRLLTSGAS